MGSPGRDGETDRGSGQRQDRSRATICVLPAPVVARIAAGEVIERPASVVKELVENALDAGARHIRVDVRGGGLTFIRVGDDGEGISPDELRLACERHATSKLPSADLGLVRTLGFRGEALPSIAAVAELTLVSAVDQRGVGHRLTLQEGQVVADEPAPHPLGTTVTVGRLFQNVPARLATTNRVQTEIAQIGQTVRRLAIAAPHVRLALFVDDRLVVRTSGSRDLATVLVEVYGPALADRQVPLGPVEVAGARLHGVVAGPGVTRPRRDQVNVIVNGRWVQPRGLLGLLERAYRSVLPHGRHPVLAVNIETAPDQIDINIHPTKLEVRLLAEHAIGTALGDLVQTALGQQPLALEGIPAGLAGLGPSPALHEDAPDWDEERPIVTPGLPPLQLVGQVQDRLLLLEGPDGLYLIDQHRAHERILYERLVAAHTRADLEPITLPEPLVVELRPGQMPHVSRRLDELTALGFQCEPFGRHMILLRAAPDLPGVLPSYAGQALSGLGQPDELVPTLLALDEADFAEDEDGRAQVLVQLACRTALRRGRRLDRPAMRALIEALGQTNAPAVCPHGSPLLMHVSGALLEREFRWR